MLIKELQYSTRVSDSLQHSLVEFNGPPTVEQGDWEYARKFNTKLMPSLRPRYKDVSKRGYADWRTFSTIQRYTDGEGFFLCFPAAFYFGMIDSGVDSNKLPAIEWIEHYKDSQSSVQYRIQNSNQLSPSSQFVDRIQYLKISEIIATTESDLSCVVPDILSLVQVACVYPMFGNRMYGHYVSVTEMTHQNNEIYANVAGSLAPFGIYDTPYALVKLNELARFARISTKLMQGMNRKDKVIMQDGAEQTGFEIMTFKIPS